MVSLTVVIVTFALIFGSLYLIFRMNRKPQLQKGHHRAHRAMTGSMTPHKKGG